MTSLDYIIISIAAVLIIRGFIKGFIREILGLISIIAAFLVAYLFSTQLASLISQYIDSEKGSMILSYAALFMGTALLINYLGKLLTSLSKAVSLSFINRLLGGLFGLLKCLFLLFAMWYLLDFLVLSFNISLPEEVSNSQILKAFKKNIINVY